MQKKLFILILVALGAFGRTSAQNYTEKFRKLIVEKDSTGVEKLLREWEKSSPRDPEMFIAQYNYFALKSKREVVSLTPEKPKGEGFLLSNTESGEPAGFLGTTVTYDSATLRRGFDYIDRGIALYPTRLDMRFGRMYMLGESGQFAEFTKKILETIELGYKTGHRWTWKGDKPLEDPKGFFLGSMQTYVRTLYETGDDGHLPMMREISEAVLRYEPDHVESLSNIAISYLVAQEMGKALPYLLRAEAIAPTDIVILSNIAEAYSRQGDVINAKLYYEKIIEHGNEEEKEFAREKIPTEK